MGYHVDDGRIFDASNCTKGVEIEGKELLLNTSLQERSNMSVNLGESRNPN